MNSAEAFELLLQQYEHAINERDVAQVDALCLRVEEAADRIGFTEHGRVLALHQRAEGMFNDPRTRQE